MPLLNVMGMNKLGTESNLDCVSYNGAQDLRVLVEFRACKLFIVHSHLGTDADEEAL